MIALVLVFVGLLGLAIGSFLTVVAHRLPRGESLVSPGSRCPSCAVPIRPWHNVPVLGWLVLRGRCASCGARISLRYPLVEAGTGLLFVAVTARLAALDQPAAVPAFLFFTAVGIALSLIDLETKRLPNRLVLPAYPVLAVLLAAAAGWQGDWWAFVRALIGGAALYAFFFAVVFIYPAGMGFGDVKLAGLIGGVLGYLSWATLIIGAFAGFLLGAVIGVALIAAGRAGRKTAVPFGPFMVAGALLAVFVADPIADWYGSLLS
jgi:leader peptidase (prepilin peptidase) / N-methyltransferase